MKNFQLQKVLEHRFAMNLNEVAYESKIGRVSTIFCNGDQIGIDYSVTGFSIKTSSSQSNHKIYNALPLINSGIINEHERTI